jgi:hypothetical protein
VDRLAAEAELGRDDGQRTLQVGAVVVGGVPAQYGIDIAECAGADHVKLAVAAFFGGGAVETDSAGAFGIGQPVFERDRGKRDAAPSKLWPQA